MAAALNGLGYAVPGDVSLMGFGVSHKAFAPGKRISSVWVDIPGLGRGAARLFLDALKGEPPRRLVLPIHLDLRDSVASRSLLEQRDG
jgi:DNA-binding LacI/PurR family transcriptional regulator